jgi:ATP-dependent Clp protease ATP-binding subunit ClpC
MASANSATQPFHHEYVGTEHMLLGILASGEGVATSVLQNLGVDLQELQAETKKRMSVSAPLVTMGKLPLTPRAKFALAKAEAARVELGHTYIGTEHLLLGLIAEEDGLAAKVLASFGVTYDRVKEEIRNLLGAGKPKRPELQ